MNWQEARVRLVEQLRQKGIKENKILMAISHIPRHSFVESGCQDQAYDDTALPITHQQTISQPYVVARMTEILLRGESMSKVLEIGTGSGYQAAVLSHLVENVYSVERIEPLYLRAKQCLDALNIKNVSLLYGDGCQGWAEHAPYQGIIVTAATNIVPPPLLEQLADNGRLVIPLGEPGFQRLQAITRHGDNYVVEEFDTVLFVPLLTGKT